MNEKETKGIRLVCDPEIPAGDIGDAIRAAGAKLGIDVVSGDVVSCDTCGFFDCVCEIRKTHANDCAYRRAMEAMVGIHCDHGYDVCPECDPCTCKEPRSDIPSSCS